MDESKSTADTDQLEVLRLSSDEDERVESSLDGSKPICFIGKLEKDNCAYWSGRGKRLPSEVFKNCSEDVTSHLSSFLSSSEIEQCPNSNEQWLIENRFGADIDENAFLCGKHRSKYGLGFKGVKC